MIKTLFYLTLIVTIAFAAQQCLWKPNNLQLIDEEMELIQSVQNGQKYLIGNLNDTDGNYLYIAKLKGSSYQMGLAYGKLFKQELKDQIQRFYGYIQQMIIQSINDQSLPPFVAKFLSAKTLPALNALLDLDVAVTKRYTNKRYHQQILGIAEGAGINYKSLQRINIFPQFIKASCTVAGIWKKAASQGKTLHMRALDWDYKNPISKYPVVITYHPTQKNSLKHANIGYIGFVGMLTGVSQKISIGQKVWIPQKNTIKTTRFGNPWTYVLRDVLYKSHNMSQALETLTKTQRTCTIHLGVGSKQDHQFRMFEYSQNILNNYDDNNYTHYSKNHIKKQGIAFFDKHKQPSNDPCMSNTITNQTMYGQWTAQSFWRTVGNIHQTGDTQLVVWDLQGQKMYVSYSHITSEQDGNIQAIKAYRRSPIKIDLNDLWSAF